MEGEDAARVVRVLALHHGLTGHPVVRMSNVEVPHQRRGLPEAPHHGVAHLLHLLHEVFTLMALNPMITHAVDLLMQLLALGAPSEDVHLSAETARFKALKIRSTSTSFPYIYLQT